MAIRGPSIWDRLLGMQLVSTKIITIIIVYASVSNTAFMLDVAIIYTMFGFIGTIFVTLFIRGVKSGNTSINKSIISGGKK